VEGKEKLFEVETVTTVSEKKVTRAEIKARIQAMKDGKEVCQAQIATYNADIKSLQDLLAAQKATFDGDEGVEA
jgi:hypothetical protein